jgi:hypothetical protein
MCDAFLARDASRTSLPTRSSGTSHATGFSIVGSPNSADAEVLRARHEAAAAHLGQSVAALEGIRLDLLRLHAGASDLTPLTTLMDEARLLRDDVRRLAAAQQEAEAAAGGSVGVRRISTPA